MGGIGDEYAVGCRENIAQLNNWIVGVCDGTCVGRWLVGTSVGVCDGTWVGTRLVGTRVGTRLVGTSVGTRLVGTKLGVCTVSEFGFCLRIIVGFFVVIAANGGGRRINRLIGLGVGETDRVSSFVINGPVCFLVSSFSTTGLGRFVGFLVTSLNVIVGMF